MARVNTPEEAVDLLTEHFERAVDALTGAVRRYVADGQSPDREERALFRYPELRVRYDGRESRRARGSRAFGQLIWPGDYAVSITQPRHFRSYLLDQLRPLHDDFGALIEVGVSEQEIPYSFVIDGLDGIDPNTVKMSDLARRFPFPKLADVGDAVVDGDLLHRADGARPLSLFEAPRVDMSLKRLEHYTGSPWADVQPWILFTNYQRYVEEFIRWAAQEVANTPGAVLSCAGRVRLDASHPNIAETAMNAPWRKFQMPAYHLIRPDGGGISLVNIGVGPSNAKTITDHLAVLRPHCWIMVGHCGGLRATQRIGDYVLAHAYLRRDKILDDQVPLEIPIPAIAEVQVALQQATAETSARGEELKARLRTGTVVSYADRNWELNFIEERRRLSQSRAVAVDMESACIATQGFRMRVPYGVLLCVSDKPLHGEIKLPGQADHFYESAIGAHLQIGIRTIELLQANVNALHSRKLRSFDEPAFR